MEFNNIVRWETQRRVQSLGILSKSGPIRIAKSGSDLKKILYQLKNSNLQLSDEDQAIIQTFFEQFRNLITHHKEYMSFNNRIANLGLQQQIDLLTEPFTILDEKTTHLKQQIGNFLLQKGFEMQQGELVTLPQHQPEIVETEIPNLGSSNEIKPREDVIEQTRESSFSQVESNDSQTKTFENKDLSSVVDNVDLGRRTTICELTVPLQINSIKRLQPKAFSKWIGILEPELQVQYLKTATGQNQFFIGINWNLNLNFSNLKKFDYQKLHLVRFRTSNSIMKIYHFRTNNNSKLTLSFGRILKMKNQEINVSTNFALNNTRLKKENLSFQLEFKSCPYNIACKNQSYLTFQQTTCYEFFPYKNNFMSNFENLTQKTKNLSTANKTLDFIGTQASYAGTIVNQPSHRSEIEKSAVTADLVMEKKIEKENYSPPRSKQFASVSVAPPVVRTDLDSSVFCALGLALGIAFFGIRKFFGKQNQNEIFY